MSTKRDEITKSEVKKKPKTGSSKAHNDMGKYREGSSKKTEEKVINSKTSLKTTVAAKAPENENTSRRTKSHTSDKISTKSVKDQTVSHKSRSSRKSVDILTSSNKIRKEIGETPAKTTSKRSINEATIPNSSKGSTNLRTAATKRAQISKTRTSDATDSSRATRLQYFPSKSIYSNALSEEALKNIRKSETNSITPRKSSSTSVKKASVTSEQTSIREFIREKRHEKQKIREVSPDSSSMSERPGTATLKKGKIVNKNIAGPEAPKVIESKVSKQPRGNKKSNVKKFAEESVMKHKAEELTSDISHPDIYELSGKDVSESKTVEKLAVSPKPESPNETQYEDDFESYESDFEAYTSSSAITPDSSEKSEEVSTTNSDNDEGKVDLPREYKTTLEEKSPDNTLNPSVTDDEKDSGHFEFHDYKHKQMLQNIKECIEKENASVEQARLNPPSLSDEGFEESKSLQNIISLAQNKLQRQKILESREKRGEELMNMITLDVVSFNILDLPSVPYDTFIKTYGRSNTAQCYTQTGEDNSSEEVQTNVIETSDMWTQYPAVLTRMNYEDTSEFWKSYMSDVTGVGGNRIKEPDKDVNPTYVEKFILSAGSLMLELLTETSRNLSSSLLKGERDIPFSNGYISLRIDFVEDLSGCPIKDVSFCRTNPFKILTAHGLKDKAVEKAISTRSVLCLWNLSDNSKPDKVLSVFGDVTCCCFGFDNIHLVFGGLDDGSVAVWNTREDNSLHEHLSELVYSDIYFRMPTFITEVGDGHFSKVVGIHPLRDSTNNEKYFNNITTREICTLDENGDIIIWSVLRKYNTKKKTISDVEGSLSPWASVYLVKNILISLADNYPDLMDLQCTDFIINDLDSNHIFVSTNYGYVLHCLTNGSRTDLKKFGADFRSGANCIEACPFSPQYFVCGYEDGNLSLFSRDRKKPLNILLSGNEDSRNYEVKTVRWSPQNPFLLYVKDETSTIHIWDLYQSDLFPIYSVPFQGNITSMALSTTVKVSQSNKGITYLATGTDNGQVHVHVLNEAVFESSGNSQDINLKKFLNYVNRL